MWRSEWHDSEKPVSSATFTKKTTPPSPSRGPLGGTSDREGVEPQEEQRDECQVQEVPMDVLEDEREGVSIAYLRWIFGSPTAHPGGSAK